MKISCASSQINHSSESQAKRFDNWSPLTWQLNRAKRQITAQLKGILELLVLQSPRQVKFKNVYLSRDLTNSTENQSSPSGSNTESTPTKKCDSCSKPESDPEKPLKACSKCQSAHYCSRECQKADFKKHKKVCAEKAQIYAMGADLKMSAPRAPKKEGHRGGLQKWQFDTWL